MSSILAQIKSLHDPVERAWREQQTEKNLAVAAVLHRTPPPPVGEEAPIGAVPPDQVEVNTDAVIETFAAIADLPPGRLKMSPLLSNVDRTFAAFEVRYIGVTDGKFILAAVPCHELIVAIETAQNPEAFGRHWCDKCEAGEH